MLASTFGLVVLSASAHDTLVGLVGPFSFDLGAFGDAADASKLFEVRIKLAVDTAEPCVWWCHAVGIGTYVAQFIHVVDGFCPQQFPCMLGQARCNHHS